MLFKVHGCACQIDVCGVQWLKQSVCGGLRDEAWQLYRHQAVAGDCKYLLPEAMTGDILCRTVMRGQPATCAANITQLHPAAGLVCQCALCLTAPDCTVAHCGPAAAQTRGKKQSVWAESGAARLPQCSAGPGHSALPG